eukprot:TRINITY_DN8_c0_g2_i1.p1 TRINITY_DN8_c0_g2~~TRINITY_DN8_c0_g2_i1.p1  ORF type:complete len:564 (+),score=82.06 TRINITY_DN8_c0_g2_i1:105-1796(+)
MELTVVLLVATIVHINAGGFLAHLPLTMTRNVSDPNFRRAVFAELEVVLGGNLSDSTKKRVDDIEEVIRPIFVSMQKHAHGKLDKNAVKYVLRRLFIKRQGWVIEGLEPTGETNSMIFGEKAPLIVQDVIKKHIGVDGAGLHEVAVIAAMMEHLIFEETVGKLVQAYKAKQISTDAEVSRAQAEDLVLLHMAAFIRARDVGMWTPKQVRSFQRAIYTLYPHWATIVPSMSALFDVVTPGVDKFKFDHVASVASEASKEFAQWQNNMCQSTFDHLLEIQDGQTGRVRLVDFYNAALHKGRYQFTETITYLRQLGTLDESDDTNPRVIIPNYLLGRSNCVARTSYYSVCCLDDCEVLFSALERTLPKAFATSNEIVKAAQDISYASRFSESYTDGFSEELRRRLDEVAAHHDGFIPLHGRLFAQWMHLAFPQECPYPHKAGTVYYSSMENWEKETGQRSGSTLEEIEKWSSHLSELAQNRSELQRENDADADTSMWTMEEELVTAWQPKTSRNDDFVENAHSKSKLGWLAVASGGVCLTFISRKLIPSIRGTGMIDKRYVDKWSV